MLILLAAAIGGAASVRAADFTWNNTGTALWSVGTWSGAGTFPNSATANVITPTAYGRADLDGNYVVGNFVFGTSTNPASATWQVVAQNTAALRSLEITGTLSVGRVASGVTSDLLFRNTTNGQLSLKVNSIDSAGRIFFGQNETAPLTRFEAVGLTTISGGLIAVTSNDATFGEVRLTQDIPETETIFRVNNFRTNNTLGGVTVAGLAGTGGTVQGANAQTGQTVVGTLRVNAVAGTNYAFNGALIDGIGLGTNRLAVVKAGAGTQAFGGGSTYSGGTTIQEGTLLVNNGSATGSGLGIGMVSVAAGSTLGGSGYISLGGSNSIVVAAGGTIAPGTLAFGTLTLSGAATDGAILNMANGSAFRFKLGAGNASDRVALWNYTGATDFRLGGVRIDFSGAEAGNYTLFEFFSDDGLNPAASGISTGFNVNSFTGLDGYQVAFNYNVSSISMTLTAVPEPGTLALVLAAGIGTLFVPQEVPEMNRKGFTLIELLTVVSILAVLIAIALPIINSVLLNQKQSQCLAHAKQLGIANAAYQADNNGQICGMGQVLESSGESSNWMTRMRPYFAADTYADVRLTYMCPSHPQFVKDNAAHTGWALNTQLAPVASVQKRITQIPQPSRTIYATDGYRDFDWTAGDGQRVGYTVPTAKKNNYPAGERVFFPHRGKTVASFLDGHIEMLSAPIAQDLWTIQK